MLYKVVVFTGVGCAPCTSLKEKLAAEFIEFEEKPVMQNMAEARELGVRAVPYTLVYKNDVLVGSAVGNSVNEIKRIING